MIFVAIAILSRSDACNAEFVKINLYEGIMVELLSITRFSFYFECPRIALKYKIEILIKYFVVTVL